LEALDLLVFGDVVAFAPRRLILGLLIQRLLELPVLLDEMLHDLLVHVSLLAMALPSRRLIKMRKIQWLGRFVVRGDHGSTKVVEVVALRSDQGTCGLPEVLGASGDVLD